MKILVTGGAGYVGSVCVRDLCNGGHEVIVYDSLLNGHRGAVDGRARLVIADLADGESLNRQLSAGIDVVFHFAALAEVGESVKDPLRYYHNNVIHSIALLESMRRHNVRRMIFSSSCAVYGMPPRVPITEDMPRNPINPYGRTKLAIEWVMEDCCRAWGLGATALRYFNAAGATADGKLGEDHDPESHLIPRVLRAAMGQVENISIFGADYPTSDGTCVRDYVHVEDLASAHRLALNRLEPGQFRAMNLGTGTGASVREVIEACRSVSGHEIKVIEGPRREGDPPQLYADASMARRELQWSPRYMNIRDIVETAWKWHRANPDGFLS